MPAIARIRFTNVIYENGGKRYNDETFLFDGHNSAFLLENGGGKTVFIQTALQAIIPHINMAERKIKDTLSLENGPAHIAIEWIINDRPRRYALTAVSLYIENNALNSLKYTYDYDAQDSHGIEEIPFSVGVSEDRKRPATRGEISDYYSRMARQSTHANVFTTIQDYGKFIETTYKIIPSEWRKVATINSGEGNVDEFFSKCRTTDQLLSNLLIPVVEEAIEGDHAAGFVETFERQREHFKKNRILQDKIGQSRLIKEKLDEYVDVYRGYEKERTGLQSLKEEAKTVTNYVRNQLTVKEEELKVNDENQLQLKKDYRIFEQEQKSFDFYLLKEQVRNQEKEQKELLNRLKEVQDRHDRLARRKQNIEITALQRDLSSEEAHVVLLEEELSQVDAEFEISDLKKQLEENSSNIKGQFVYELELIDREGGRIDEEISELKLKHSQLSDQLDSAHAYEKDLIGQRSQLEAMAAMIRSSEQRMSAQLFGDGPVVALSLEKDRVQSRLLQLRKEKEACDERLKSLNQYISTKTKANESLLDQKVLNKEQLSSAAEQLKQLERHMEAIRVDVEAAGYPLFLNGNIYSKETSIIRELEEQREYALQQKEKAIRQERISLRQFDVYEELSHYMSEPLLEGIVESLAGKVDYVELGSQFIGNFGAGYGGTSSELFDRWPFWSLSLVTSVKNIEEVRAAVAGQSSRLSHMVMVISREEASKLVLGQSEGVRLGSGATVYPDEWRTGLEPDRYYEWQQSLRVVANQAIEERKAKEQASIAAEALLKRTKSFFSEYPYDQYEGLKAVISSRETELKQVAGDLRALDMGIREDQDSLLKVTGMLSDLTIESQALEGRMRLIDQMEEEGQNAESTEQRLDAVLKNALELGRRIERYRSSMTDFERQLEEAGRDRRKYDTEKERVLNLELYQEVKSYEPYGTNASLESLKEIRTQLKNRLAGLSRGRQEIEERLSEHRRLVQRYGQELRKKSHEAFYPLETIDSYYENEAEELFEKIRNEGKLVDELKGQTNQKERQLTQLGTRCQVLEESLQRDYGGLIRFDVESQHIQQRLKIARVTLGDRSRKLVKERQTIEGLIRKLDLVYRDLEIKDGAYHYMASDVEAMKLPLDYFDGFEKAPEGIVGELLSSMEGQYAVSAKAYGAVTKKQESVMAYCRSHVSDRRLLETLATGLSSKNDWQALLIYQEKMTEIIMKIIKVAEDDKRESDLELQTFLSHLLTYVKSVATELDAIQVKTRISMENQVKQIFIFDIPEFDEDEAKLDLRNYIDETILYYEKESLQEAVDDEGLRRSLSDRLSVMRLLEVVMKERSIKIKCRKVTNDMTINKAPMTWESSNKWSGGEKWSKNMTLFLSILNYLAEKKQHLSPNQKRQRSVILDNPFGKASSDHVLKPVFMIAEKLGFQIIALTAHAEGKFISEYFPVVYSCRLRKTTDPSKQIMTNEKILNHTYLHEHSPMTIMRMQEVEQISLF